MASASLKQRLFPKGIRRSLDNWRRQIFQRVTQRDLVAVIRDLGMPPGAWICIHSRLSGLGYLAGGPRIVIDALREAVPDCTVIMPAFPFDRTCREYLESGVVYDPRTTPSASGLLSEILRTYPGARRSLHPTHPCVAVGPDAATLIEGSEHAETPFGPQSTYGRYARGAHAWQFLVHTNSTSIVHEFQEAADMPNLFLPDLYTARGLDETGHPREYRLRVHTPLLPLFVATPEYVWYPDYALPFPTEKRDHLVARMLDKDAARRIVARHEELLGSGVFRSARIRAAELMAARVAPWRDRICAEVRTTIEQYPARYEIPALEQARQRRELITT